VGTGTPASIAGGRVAGGIPVSAPRLLIGVDGGSTKTIALAATPDGTITGAGRVDRGSNIYAVSLESALDVFDEAADLALGDPRDGSGGRDETIVGAAFSLSGADWPEDIALLEGSVGRRWPGALVVNDAIGALRGAIPTGPGVVVAVGGGAATGARGKDGNTWHTSFWQEAQGAGELGLRAVDAVYRAEIGIDGPTALTARVLAATGDPDVETLLHRATARSGDPVATAILAPILLEAADAGDATAVDIVERHGRSLGLTAVAAATRVGLGSADTFPLALVGGAFLGRRALLRRSIVAAVHERAPNATVVERAFEPAVGSLLLAFDEARIEVTDAVLDRLRETTPDASLFRVPPTTVPPAA
jgi:N-acetylglucosamine kinase-like BadF-type ATPase